MIPAEMTPARWEKTQDYLEDVFADEPPELAALRRDAVAAGFPTISIGPAAGRFLSLITALVGGEAGARRIVEVGMLYGYSALCLARGLAPDGQLVTIEPDPERVAFARRRFAELGETRIEVREAEGIPALEAIASKLGPGSLDVVFLDAIKTEYVDYLERARPLLRSGGVLLADNSLGSNVYWVTDPPGVNENRDAVDRFNRAVAGDDGFEAMPVPIRQGILLARRTSAR